MSRSTEHKSQLGWRPWPRIFDALPPVQGQTILNLGCGVGDQAAEFVARGARVIGIDIFCGADFEQVQEEFLGCLIRADHGSVAKVYCCIATK